MRTVGIFEAKQKLSELVERASRGERIRITRRGKLGRRLCRRGKRRWTLRSFSLRWREFESVLSLFLAV